MVGILLLTHAPLGQAFIAAVAHVFRGPTERFEAIDSYMLECVADFCDRENEILASIPNTGRVNGKPLSEGMYLGIE